ncbi:MAG: N-6 DNA methylase [Alphaproteobacteria bacterium]|nr:N-6 DNA methylase [Alphaproteobacteria bacterium]MBU1526712.1 N-6 DNA methylase [Alphaproteobacteria bacterium]MBU2116689.1 N-6 DNA methylase [Alphaproteobacteria bacterium]MBU2352146.1 N-6 DNA methylase [Alphaproteobacteria bacterium]MBU2381829.1 N-6 DNA methylase [Alphaproteobacteria bacterium]
MTSTLEEAVARFGKSAKDKLNNPGATGQPEDQLRAPLETLVADLCALIGPSADDVVLVGESALSELMTRPDYAVTRKNALVGHIEVKAPGKGADPRKFADKSHDKTQWEKLKSLPNLIYTDGQTFSLWRDGVKVGEIVRLDGDLDTAGAKLTAPPALTALIADFLSWNPVPPRTPKQLAETTARLCRLLRDEVEEQLERKAPALIGLMEDWRQLLLPDAEEPEFADGYAQAVTFGLLMAKARGIELAGGLDAAGKALSQTNTLIGSALKLLTEPAEEAHLLETSIDTLVRVLDVVNWKALSKGQPEAWLYFYELFLQSYDTKLRKKTGSYYTPPEVVTAMVRMVDEALIAPGRFSLARGLASPEVKLADPAVGTGTFLLGVLNRIARTVEEAEGKGSVPAAVQDALKRLIGFELQFGPFAVAQLRLLAEIADLTEADADTADASELRLYITDTLADPDEEAAWVPHPVRAIAESRKQSNRVKRHEAITVVLGNPPYKEKAKGLGGWVEDRGKGQRTPLDDWQPPVDWGVGAHTKHLRNLYVYFWRWAAWKVFGGDTFRSGSDKTEAVDWTKRQGIVCFITVSGFLNGPGFQKMRSDLRRDADEIWVIDCSPEGWQPPVATRIFEGVQQTVCIVMALRKSKDSPETPARVRFRTLPEGSRSVKFAALAGIGLDDDGWVEAASEPRAPFLPPGAASWIGYPALEDLFVYNGSGVMAGRTWVIAPDAQSLRDRWARLVAEKDPAKKAVLFHPHMNGDKTLTKVAKESLEGHKHPPVSVDDDKGPGAEPVRYGYRSFDREWLLPDSRLINRANPTLWKGHSLKQVYATGLFAHSPTAGPALTFSGLIPDLHHYKGSFGGRVFPLWADAAATSPNVSPGLLKALGEHYGAPVSAEDVMAYIAALAAHPAYIERFRGDLKQPGLRIPITADGALFAEAAAVGREVIWLHTFGERFQGDRGGVVRVTPAEFEPTVSKALPRTLAEMPHDLNYDPAERALKFGSTGRIDNVSPAVRAYEVSGKVVLDQWWSYRRADRSKPAMGDKRPPSPLSEIQPTDWLAEYTTELLNVLRVLTRLVALEPRQAELLGRIVAEPTLDADVLGSAGALSDASASAEAEAGEAD